MTWRSGIIACLCMAGCTMPRDEIHIKGEITDGTGTHRLRLNYVLVSSTRIKEGYESGYDFHSLAWEIRDSGEWKARTVITEADFQAGADRRRWVSKLHDFDPASGHAIIQVGEEGYPQPDGSIHVTYSWREWDIERNAEVRTIRICESPFEPFDEPADDR